MTVDAAAAPGSNAARLGELIVGDDLNLELADMAEATNEASAALARLVEYVKAHYDSDAELRQRLRGYLEAHSRLMQAMVDQASAIKPDEEPE
jgi:hypothetical protein